MAIVKHISEDDIKEVSLRYLRHYYRHQPREGAMILTSDLRGAGGIVADGYIAWPRADGTFFTATFEATDYAKRNELRFSLQRDLLWWDAVTVGALLIAAVFFVFHIATKDLHFIATQPLLGIGSVLGALLLASVCMRFLLQSLRRYRYVYAVEQFKQYYADDQWISFSWDVFYGKHDPYFLELRRQVIRNGFGLLEVDQELKIKMHVAPARDDTFGYQRQVVQFFSEGEFSRRVQQQMQRFAKIASWEKLLGWRTKLPYVDNLSNLWRYRRAHYQQMTISAMAMMLIGIVFAREYADQPIIYVDEEAYEQEMLVRGEELNIAKEREVVPPLDTLVILPLQKNVQPYLSFGLDPVRQAPVAAPVHTVDFLVYEPRIKNFVEYTCERLHGPASTSYLVRLGQFYDLAFLKQKILELRGAGLPVNGLWAGCFFSGQQHYFIILEDLHATLEEAEQAADAAIPFLDTFLPKGELAIDRVNL